MGGCESTHAVSRSPQRGGSFALCAWAFLHACLYVQHTAMQHSMWQKYGQHIQAVHAAQAWYTYIHACSHARTATRMRASSLHTHQICKRSTHAAVQHRVCTSIYIDMYACGLHVQAVQHRRVCRMQTNSARVCTDAHALLYATPHAWHTFHPSSLRTQGPFVAFHKQVWASLQHKASIAQLVRARA